MDVSFIIAKKENISKFFSSFSFVFASFRKRLSTEKLPYQRGGMTD